MKAKLYIILLFCISFLYANAQTEQQERTFEELKGKFQLDDDFGYSYVRVFEDLNATKEELHTKALAAFPYAVVGTYDARKIIQHESVEEGVILAKLACNNIGEFNNLAHNYVVSATPIFRIDIKDNRMRIIASIKKLHVYHRNASGVFVTVLNDEIPSTELPPFKLDKKKKVNTMYYSAFIVLYNTITDFMNKFENSVREGNTGVKESKDDW